MSNDWVIDLDIKGFFDNIDHELLLKSVVHYCDDKWVLLYVTRWLKAGIIQQNGIVFGKRNRHTARWRNQSVDGQYFSSCGVRSMDENSSLRKPFERYADDIVVHCKTEKQALFVLKMIRQRMADCKLTLHPVKTKIVNLCSISEKKYPRSFDFLGFHDSPTLAKNQ